MHVIGQSETRAAPSSMAEIAANPQRIDLGSGRRFQEFEQGLRSARWRVFEVVNGAPVRIRIENILEFQLSERAYKIHWLHDLLPFSGMYSIVRLDRSPTTTPPLLLLTCRNT